MRHVTRLGNGKVADIPCSTAFADGGRVKSGDVSILYLDVERYIV